MLIPMLVIPVLLLCWPIWAPSTSTTALPCGVLLAGTQKEDSGVAERIRAVGNDVAALSQLAEAYSTEGERKAAEQVWRAVLSLDADHAEARRGLRHQRYDDRWFESYTALAQYKREEAARMADRGLLRWKDAWVPREDLPYLRMGWTRGTNGSYRHPEDVRLDQEAARLTAEGYEFRADDSSWVAPENFDAWRSLQWKCGDEWMDLAAANEFHDEPDQAWRLTGEHFVLLATSDWGTANSARWHADQVHAPLVRMFGCTPPRRPLVYLARTLVEYNTGAAANNRLVDSDGLSSAYGAYYADGAFDASITPSRYVGGGVTYWDPSDDSTSAWGPYWVRWAAAQSFVDAIDRSIHLIGTWVQGGGRAEITQVGSGAWNSQFWAEKRVPRWLRYGAAAYAERFLPNPEANDGADPWDLRRFARLELERVGGLRPAAEIIATPFDGSQPAVVRKLYVETGALVSFLLDGGDEAVTRAHARFVKAMTTEPDDLEVATQALEAILVDRDAALQAFSAVSD